MNRKICIGIVICILAMGLHADTDVKLYHSLNDDIVAAENSQMLYQWLKNKGVAQRHNERFE